MTLHNEIMNITVMNVKIPRGKFGEMPYKLGHRDARHAAAELSLKYERYIELLEDHLEDVDDLLFDLRKEAGL